MAKHDPTTEEWRAIPGYPNYQVSDQGRVRSLATMRGTRKKPRLVRAVRVCRRNRHLRVGLYRSGKSRLVYVHRLVLLAFDGPCPEGHETRHLDDDPRNNRIGNLRWGTHQENEQDAIRNDKKARGIRQGISRLDPKKVRDIRRRALRGETRRGIAGRFGVCKSTINQVVTGKTWTHIK